MEDSIERILEDAEKNYTDYWGCEHRCDECRANGVHADCVTAKYIDLFDRAMRFMDEHQLPEGVEWPRFEDGELVKPGDAYEKASGTTGVVTSMYLRQYGGVPTWVIGKGGGKVCVSPGGRVKRPEPEDTQEKIDADAEKDFCVYFGWEDKPCNDDGGCPAYTGGDCRAIMIRDLLRRQRELCERSAR